MKYFYFQNRIYLHENNINKSETERKKKLKY